MPYLPKYAKEKSELYNNLITGDVQEYQDHIEDLKKKVNVSGSVDAKAPLRDELGKMVSFESEIDGISLEEEHQEVRLENKQQFFVGELDNEFTHYFQPKEQDTETTGTETEASEDEINWQMNNRSYLIQFVNEYFGEENTPDMSTDKLHNRLITFFTENKKGNKNVNADGWESFRLNKKRKVRGISGKRFKEVKKDLKHFRYDEIIEDHLYRTLRGQEIWLELGFPYVIDKNIKS